MYSVSLWYIVLDRIAIFEKQFHLVQYLFYFLCVGIFFETTHGWVKATLVGVLVMLSALQSVPFWSNYFLRQIIAELQSDTKLEVSAAHFRRDNHFVEGVLTKKFGLKTAASLSKHLCSLPQSKFLHILGF